MLGSAGVSASPSFNSYSSANLADVAARVGREFHLQSDSEADFLDSTSNPMLRLQPPPTEEKHATAVDDDDDDDDFEFPSLSREPDVGSPISAGDIFYEGQIKPVFPLFNRDLLLSDVVCTGDSKPREPVPPPRTRLPLGRLFLEDRDPPSCSSSSEDEFEGAPDGSYCVWTPPEAATRRRCKKSESMGSSRRWKFLDLFRSNSDCSRKDFPVFYPPAFVSSWRKSSKEFKVIPNPVDSAAELPKAKSRSRRIAAMALKAKEADGNDFPAPVSGKGRSRKDVASTTRSLLPYKEELLGFLSNANGLSRNVQAF